MARESALLARTSRSGARCRAMWFVLGGASGQRELGPANSGEQRTHVTRVLQCLYLRAMETMDVHVVLACRSLINVASLISVACRSLILTTLW
jgi:hypothetical protein